MRTFYIFSALAACFATSWAQDSVAGGPAAAGAETSVYVVTRYSTLAIVETHTTVRTYISNGVTYTTTGTDILPSDESTTSQAPLVTTVPAPLPELSTITSTIYSCTGLASQGCKIVSTVYHVVTLTTSTYLSTVAVPTSSCDATSCNDYTISEVVTYTTVCPVSTEITTVDSTVVVTETVPASSDTPVTTSPTSQSSSTAENPGATDHFSTKRSTVKIPGGGISFPPSTKATSTSKSSSSSSLSVSPTSGEISSSESVASLLDSSALPSSTVLPSPLSPTSTDAATTSEISGEISQSSSTSSSSSSDLTTPSSLTTVTSTDFGSLIIESLTVMYTTATSSIRIIRPPTIIFPTKATTYSFSTSTSSLILPMTSSVTATTTSVSGEIPQSSSTSSSSSSDMTTISSSTESSADSSSSSVETPNGNTLHGTLPGVTVTGLPPISIPIKTTTSVSKSSSSSSSSSSTLRGIASTSAHTSTSRSHTHKGHTLPGSTTLTYHSPIPPKSKPIKTTTPSAVTSRSSSSSSSSILKATALITSSTKLPSSSSSKSLSSVQTVSANFKGTAPPGWTPPPFTIQTVTITRPPHSGVIIFGGTTIYPRPPSTAAYTETTFTADSQSSPSSSLSISEASSSFATSTDLPASLSSSSLEMTITSSISISEASPSPSVESTIAPSPPISDASSAITSSTELPASSSSSSVKSSIDPPASTLSTITTTASTILAKAIRAPSATEFCSSTYTYAAMSPTSLVIPAQGTQGLEVTFNGTIWTVPTGVGLTLVLASESASAVPKMKGRFMRRD